MYLLMNGMSKVADSTIVSFGLTEILRSKHRVAAILFAIYGICYDYPNRQPISAPRFSGRPSKRTNHSAAI